MTIIGRSGHGSRHVATRNEAKPRVAAPTVVGDNRRGSSDQHSRATAAAIPTRRDAGNGCRILAESPP